MARNVSSKFSLDEGFDQEIEDLHNNKNKTNENKSARDNVKGTERANRTENTLDINSEDGEQDTNNVDNTNSANSVINVVSAVANDQTKDAANSETNKTDLSTSFDPAKEAEFIAKNCLYDNSKTKRITIQFNRDIYDYIKRESRVRGLSINNFVRMIILSYMSVPGNKHYVDI